MIKRLLLVLTIIIVNIFFNLVFSQSLGINATGAPAANSSILDVSSTDKGMLVPRMNKAQRNAIVSPVIGLLVFQNAPDSAGFYYYDGAKWSWLAALNGNVDSLAWNRKGNAGTNPLQNFIGTTDDQPLQLKVNNIKAGSIDQQKKNVLLGTRAALNLSASSFDNTIIGDSAFYSNNQTSTSNVVIGYGAQAQSNVAANNNTVIGWNTGQNNIASNTTIIGTSAGQNNIADGNVFLGSSAGKKNTTGLYNSFVGDNAGRDNTTGFANAFFGSYAGGSSNGFYNSIFGSLAGQQSTGNNNCFFGTETGFSNSTGSGNMFMGPLAGYTNTIGNNNTAIGDSALLSNTSGNRNVAIGAHALNNNFSGSLNIAIGDSAGFTNISSNNVMIGSKSSQSLVSGTANTIIGDNTAYKMTSGSNNVFLGNNVGKTVTANPVNAVVIGTQAGDTSIASWSTIIGNLAGRKNTAIGNTIIGSSAGQFNAGGVVTLVGDNAGKNNVTGYLTAIGAYAGFNSKGDENTFVGRNAGYFNIDGYYNSFLGAQAGYNNVSGYDNSFFGPQAGYKNINGATNSFFGAFSGYNLKLSSGNAVFGYFALGGSDTSSYNSVFGTSAATNLKNGEGNSAFGYSSGFGLKNGDENTTIGFEASVGDTASYSVSMGSQAGSKGDNNVFIGYLAGDNNSTASITNSVYIGSNAGFYKRASNSILLGYSSSVLTDGLSNVTAIGANSRVDVSNAMVLGSAGTNVGMGVTSPTHAKLTLYSDALNGTALGIFGFGQNGISIQQNWPTIGYNQYRDLAAANSAKYMGNGFAWVNTMEPTSGNIYWNSMPSGIANAAGGAETNRMTLTNSGFLGLNNSSPHAAIQVDNQVNNRRIVLWEQNNNTTEFFGFGINSGVLRYQVPNANAGNAHEFFAANTLLFTIFGNGNATLAGTLTQLSDARLKKNITPISHALDGLSKLNAYNYYWIDETKDNEQQVGLLAQEVEKVFPQLVKKNNDGMLSVNYSGFTPLLIKGMQEQQQTIDDLKKQVDELRQMIIDMKSAK